MALTWIAMVLLTKGGGEYREIGLVEFRWKVCALIMNNRLQNAVILHGNLHGFS